MSKKEKESKSPDQEQTRTEAAQAEQAVPPDQEPEAAPQGEQQAADQAAPQPEAQEPQAAPDDRFLRLAAEYDNYRKRTAKEKEALWAQAKADTAVAFLPVYDNLERALKQETADEAYKKGVEMTMMGLKEILTKLGIEEIPALGETFDPALHNAVMHVEDDTVGENTIVDVFQAGFRLGGKVIRFAMVKVAN